MAKSFVFSVALAFLVTPALAQTPPPPPAPPQPEAPATPPPAATPPAPTTPPAPPPAPVIPPSPTEPPPPPAAPPAVAEPPPAPAAPPAVAEPSPPPAPAPTAVAEPPPAPVPPASAPAAGPASMGATEVVAAPAGSAAAEPVAPVAATAGDAQKAAVAGDKPAESKAPTASASESMESFYKGDFGNPAGGLESQNSSFFVGLGYYNIGGLLGQHYARLTPQLNLHFDVAPEKELILRLAGPVNMLLYDRASTAKNHGRGEIRSEDFDEARDFVKILRGLKLGRKEDKFFLNIGLTNAVTLGHGTVMRRYNANMDLDRSRLGVQLDAYGEFGGFETFVADVTGQTQIFGGLFFVKPLAMATDNPIAKTWSVGAHYTTDQNAPKELKRDPALAGPLGRVQVDEFGYPTFTTTAVGIWGIDTEIKPVRLGNTLDLKMYADYSRIVGAGGGMSGGMLLRSNFGVRPLLSAFRFRLEGRLYDHDYIPAYFDGLYDIQKFQIVRGTPTGLEPTKYQAVVNNAVPVGNASVFAEAAYSLVDNLVLSVALEKLASTGVGDTKTPDLYNLLVHLEVPAFEFLRLYASYQKLGYQSLADSFEKGASDSAFSFPPNAVFMAQARLMVLPVLFITGTARQTFQWDSRYRDPDGNTVGAYVPKLDYLGEIELGWEFD